MPDAARSPDVDEIVQTEILRFLAATGRRVAALSADEALVEGLGIASCDLVVLVAALNAKLRADPFRQSFGLTDLRTVGDLCRAYREPRGAIRPQGTQDPLDTSHRRAQARRTACQR